MILVFIGSLFIFASPGGSTIHPSLIQVAVWRGTIGVPTPVPGLLLTALVKGYLLMATAALALSTQRLRSDPVAQLLFAVSLLGFGAAWVVYHPGLSQQFFWTSAIPFAVILSAWVLVVTWDSMVDRRGDVLRFTLAAALALLGSMLVVRFSTDARSPVLPGWLALITTSLIIGAVAFQLRIAPRSAFLIATLTAIALTVPITLIKAPWDPRPAVNPRQLAESEGAQWVRTHTGLYDELATNRHCFGPNAPHCDARKFLLSGFGGRRVLLGGYGVSPNALRRNDIDGYKAWRQPYHDQDLLRLNDGAFESPTAGTLRRLYQEYRVRWLVADRYAGPVSPALDQLADLAYANEWIRIYRLDPAKW